MIRFIGIRTQKIPTWKAKCPIFKAIVAGFRGKAAQKNRTLGVPGRTQTLFTQPEILIWMSINKTKSWIYIPHLRLRHQDSYMF